MSAENMQAQVIGHMIVEAIIEDDKPESGGYDLSAGMFGPALSKVVRGVAEDFILLARETHKVKDELAALRAENTHLKLALALAEAPRNKEKGFTPC